jgi:hypothetical protein
MTLRQRTAAATRACCQVLPRLNSRDPCYDPSTLFKPYNICWGFFLEVLSSPVPRIWPFAASVTIFEGSEDFSFRTNLEIVISIPRTVKMARKMPARDQIVKLIVGAGQASPSPPVGPALGSKGVKSMDFCKVPTPCIRSAGGPVIDHACRNSMLVQPILHLESQCPLG